MRVISQWRTKMRWTYDLTGAEPIIRDEPVYDGTSISNGSLMILGVSTNSGLDMGIALVRNTLTGSGAAVDAVGILQESTFEVTAPSTTYATSTGPYLGKVIINPFAVYRAEYYTGTSDDVAVESGSSSGSILETLSATGANTLDGYWMYFTHNSTTSSVKGALRMITANDTLGVTITALATTPATTDLYIFISPPHAYASSISTDSKGLSSAVTMDQSENCTNIRVAQSWIESASLGFIPLNGYKDRDRQLLLGALDGLDANTKFYSDLVLKDHLYGSQE